MFIHHLAQQLNLRLFPVIVFVLVAGNNQSLAGRAILPLYPYLLGMARDSLHLDIGTALQTALDIKTEIVAIPDLGVDAIKIAEIDVDNAKGTMFVIFLDDFNVALVSAWVHVGEVLQYEETVLAIARTLNNSSEGGASDNLD